MAVPGEVGQHPQKPAGVSQRGAIRKEADGGGGAGKPRVERD